MSILGTSPTAIRVMDMKIAEALGSMEAALILQQLHYWMEKEGVGVKINNAKYVYNSFSDWVSQQFTFLTEWKFRKAMSLLRSLLIVDVIRYKAPQWNQTNYYNLNYKKLREWAEAESIEISEMCNTPPQDERSQTLEMRDPDISLYEPKITNQKETAKQELSDRFSRKSEQFAAAQLKKPIEEEISQKGDNPHSVELTASPGQKKHKSGLDKSNIGKDKSSAQVDYIVNRNWKDLIPLLDSTGIPINKTVTNLLKLYPPQKVEGAIALLKARKRDSHIPNPSGYFVSALKGDWGAKNLVEKKGDRCQSSEIDKAALFRHWYDLARELGYCSGQEIRSGEQWICLSGSWEKWSDAVNRGYSLDYLKKIMKRNQKR